MSDSEKSSSWSTANIIRMSSSSLRHHYHHHHHHHHYHYPHHPQPHLHSNLHLHSHYQHQHLPSLLFLTLHLLLLFSVVVVASTSKLNSNGPQQQQHQSSSVHLPTIDGHIASISTSSHSSPTTPSSHPSSQSSSQSQSSSSLGCTAPEVLVNGSPSASIGGTVNGGPMGSISEIQFVGIVTAAASAGTAGNQTGKEGHPPTTQKRICKIKCLNGLWIGPLCALQNAELFEPILRPCSVPSIGNATISEVSGPGPEAAAAEKGGGGAEVSSKDSEESTTTANNRLLPHGSIIRVSCRPLGEYRLMGTGELSCVDGLWSGAQLPTCQLTTMHSNFSVGSPPTILYTLLDGADLGTGETSGEIPGVGVDSHGRLVVPPTSMLHLDCLFLKSFGQPRWTVVRTGEGEEEEDDDEGEEGSVPKRQSKKSRRAENTGWAISSSAGFSQYRLALYSASSADSGRYTCHTPNGLSNDIELVVKDVQCPPMESVMEQGGDRHRVHSISGRRMNDRVKFGCLPGYQLLGARESVCTADGRWSRAVPRCAPVRCPISPDRPLDSKLFIEVHEGSNNNDSSSSTLDALSWLSTISSSSSPSGKESWASVGTSISFRCATGYRMITNGESGQSSNSGTTQLVVSCTAEGRWSADFPKCQLIVCPAPSPPSQGSMTEAGPAPDRRYLLGDFVQFQCASGHLLKGAAVSSCQADGTWSAQTPLCIPVCPYPSSLHHGHLLPTKVQYEALEKATVVCERSYSRQMSSSTSSTSSSSNSIICLSDGTWSDSVQCVRR